MQPIADQINRRAQAFAKLFPEKTKEQLLHEIDVAPHGSGPYGHVARALRNSRGFIGDGFEALAHLLSTPEKPVSPSYADLTAAIKDDAKRERAFRKLFPSVPAEDEITIRSEAAAIDFFDACLTSNVDATEEELALAFAYLTGGEPRPDERLILEHLLKAAHAKAPTETERALGIPAEAGEEGDSEVSPGPSDVSSGYEDAHRQKVLAREKELEGIEWMPTVATEKEREQIVERGIPIQVVRLKGTSGPPVVMVEELQFNLIALAGRRLNALKLLQHLYTQIEDETQRSQLRRILGAL